MTNPDSPKHAGRLLVLDDEPDVCELLQRGLGRRGFEVDGATRPEQALTRLASTEYDAMLLDLHLEEGADADAGLALCKRVVERHPAMPVVVLTGHGSLETAVGAIRAGAHDFTTKPVDIEALSLRVAGAVRHGQLQSEVRRLRAELDQRSDPDTMGLVGQSPPMQRVRSLVRRVSDSEASVLVTGDSGTGKELVARALHAHSERAEGPFVAINCAALPAQLLESELFGHTRGAFTDARTARRGLFVDAHGGTLFLDEVGDLPLELQPKLLRALQEHRVRPVGATSEVEVDVRIVAATNRDLEHETDEGRFREDLFYRINVIRIHVPRLSRRGNDVLLLAQHFLERIAKREGKDVTGLTPDAASKLLEYEWPGNVRELENAMERAVALSRHDKITMDDLPDRIREFHGERIVLADAAEHMPTLHQLERSYIERVLKTSSGNKTQAAQILGLDRRTLYRKLERFAREDE